MAKMWAEMARTRVPLGNGSCTGPNAASAPDTLTYARCFPIAASADALPALQRGPHRTYVERIAQRLHVDALPFLQSLVEVSHRRDLRESGWAAHRRDRHRHDKRNYLRTRFRYGECDSGGP